MGAPFCSFFSSFFFLCSSLISLCFFVFSVFQCLFSVFPCFFFVFFLFLFWTPDPSPPGPSPSQKITLFPLPPHISFFLPSLGGLFVELSRFNAEVVWPGARDHVMSFLKGRRASTPACPTMPVRRAGISFSLSGIALLVNLAHDHEKRRHERGK